MGQNIRMEGVHPTPADPAVDGVEFTGSADVTLTTYGRAVYIAADGDLKVDMVGGYHGTGSTITFVGLKGGVVYPFAIKKIYDTGTTASGVVLI